MSDYNGRIHQIARHLTAQPLDIIGARLTIREVLRAEHLDGWKEGYGDGREDYAAAAELKRERAAEPLQLVWRGTDARGEEQSGRWQMIRGHIAAVAEDRFELGWRALSVTLDGQEVAGIGPHPEKPGEYLWWEGDNS